MTATLYELVTHPGSETNISPFVWTSIVDFALLDVPFKHAYCTFAQVRGELAKETGNDAVTVPTIKAGGEYVTDSWAIAQWLEKHYAKDGRSLHLPAENPNTWVLPALGGALREVFRPTFYPSLDPASGAHFVAAKYGGDRAALDADLAALRDPASVQAIVKRAQAKLQPIEERLASSGDRFFAGDKPGHTDAAIYGWVLSGKYNVPTNDKVFDPAVLPRLVAWVSDMKQVTGVDVSHPPPKLTP